jgi:hypothetical protein
MNAAPVLRQLLVTAEAAAGQAMAQAADRIVVRVEAVPGLVAEAGPDGVRVRGRGLLARAFGSRAGAADARIAALSRGEAG